MTGTSPFPNSRLSLFVLEYSMSARSSAQYSLNLANINGETYLLK